MKPMTMKPIPKILKERLIKNHIHHKKYWNDMESKNDEHPEYKEFKAVVKLFNPTGIGTWYLSELDPETNQAFGLADVHMKELGYIDLNELERFRGRMGLPIERDKYFPANKKTLNE